VASWTRTVQSQAPVWGASAHIQQRRKYVGMDSGPSAVFPLHVAADTCPTEHTSIGRRLHPLHALVVNLKGKWRRTGPGQPQRAAAEPSSEQNNSGRSSSTTVPGQLPAGRRRKPQEECIYAPGQQGRGK
jgi:hypothetical protein